MLLVIVLVALISVPQRAHAFLLPAVGRLGSFLRLIVDPYHVINPSDSPLDPTQVSSSSSSSCQSQRIVQSIFRG